MQELATAQELITENNAEFWAEKIKGEYDKTVQSIFQIGKDLISAKEKLEHGEWGKLTGKAENYNGMLPFSFQTANKYMAISKDNRLSKDAHVRILPQSWGTLYELTTLKDDEFNECIETGIVKPDMQRKDIVNFKKLAKKKAREAEIQQQVEEIENSEASTTEQKYHVISIDPPWPYETNYDPEGRRVACPYPLMSLDEISALEMPAQDDCVLWLWTTHKFLPDSFELLEKWDFEYKATMVWNKEKIGLGHWLRMQCEFCLLAVKGNPVWDNTSVRDIISSPRREHSRKPDEFFDLVDQICVGSKLEYFSREKRPGWEQIGNDKEKF